MLERTKFLFSVFQTLKMTLTSLHSQGVDDPDYLPVHTYVLNPKVLLM